MDSPKIYEKKVIINSRDVDGAGHCKASALLGYLQDASAEHSSVCGCGRKEMVERFNVFWMLTRIQLRLMRPIRWLDALTIRTGPRVGKGILLYRDYELWVEHQEVGYACALWVLSDLETRKLLNVTQTPIPELTASAGGLVPKIRHLTALHPPKELTLVEKRKMRYSDTDVNGHVNNTRYADFACDAMELDRRPQNCFLSGLEITYHQECMAGEQIQISRAVTEQNCFVHGCDLQDDARFDIRIQLDTEEIGT